MERAQLLEDLARRIVEIKLSHPLRVAIDGVDAAGKTTFANELAPIIEAKNRPVIRASIDGFHNPSNIRHMKGAFSHDGYYHDSFNYGRLTQSLLIPLGSNGTRQYRTKVFDYRTDSELDVPPAITERYAILLFDGVFLLRPEIVSYWDFTIYIDASFEETLRRAMVRDQMLFESSDELRRRYQSRYIPGQQLYLTECSPKEKAHVVIDNNDPSEPLIIF